MPNSNNTSLLSRKTLWIVGGGIVAILILLLTWLYFQQDAEIAELILNKEQLETEITGLEGDLAAMETEIQNRDIETEKKDALLQEKAVEVEKLKSQIFKLVAAGKLSEEKAMEQQGKVDQLTYYIKKYQNEIAELKAENAALKNQVEMVAGERDSIKQQYSQAKDQNTLYQVKIEGAAILKAEQFKFIPIKNNGKEQEAGTEFKADKFSKLKICCTLSENSLTRKGSKTAYLVLMNPDGSTQSGGTFESGGKSIVYTEKTRLEYQGQSLSLCFTWTPSTPLSKGIYPAKVYVEDTQVGKSSFSLK